MGSAMSNPDVNKVGRLYAAGDEVPQILIPHSGVRRMEFGVDVEVINNVMGKYGVFPMSGTVEMCFILSPQEFPDLSKTSGILVVYGVDQDTIIGCTLEENAEMKAGRLSRDDCTRTIIFTKAKDQIDFTNNIPMRFLRNLL